MVTSSASKLALILRRPRCSKLISLLVHSGTGAVLADLGVETRFYAGFTLGRFLSGEISGLASVEDGNSENWVNGYNDYSRLQTASGNLFSLPGRG